MTAIIHLVRKKEGIETFRRFIESYKKYPHTDKNAFLFLVFKGFRGEYIGDYLDVATGVMFLTFHFSDKWNALHTLYKTVKQLDERFNRIIFLNSFSEILKPEWYQRLMFAYKSVGGMISCTGSNESINPLLYPSYPNPHVRTNAFIMSKQVFLAYWNPNIYLKFQAHAFESGKNSISRKLRADTLFVGVVTTRGIYGLTCLDAARSFRDKEQEEVLLIGDNQTRRYLNADEEDKEYLYNRAWNTTT